MAHMVYQSVPELILPEFALSDLALLEDMHEGGLSEEAKDLSEKYLELRNAFLSGASVSAEDVEEVRKQNAALNTRILKDLTALRLYEEMLKVILERFQPGEDLASDAELTARFMDRMSQAVRVERALVWEMLSALPVRLTRERFYQTLTERLSVFKGGDPDVFLEKIEDLKDQAVLSLEASEDPYFAKLNAFDQIFREKKPEEFTRKEAEELKEKADTLHETLERESAFSSLLENALNALLALSLSVSYGAVFEGLLDPDKDEMRLLTADTRLYDGVSEVAYSEALEESMSLCTALEGRPEEALDRFNTRYQDLERRYSGKKHGWDEEAEKELRFGRFLNKIYSGSSYAGLSALTALEENENEPLQDEVWEKMTAGLLKDLQEDLDGTTRFYRRSVMAAALRVLPPALNSMEEVENLFYNALSGCREPAEKRIAVRRVFRIADEL